MIADIRGKREKTGFYKSCGERFELTCYGVA